MEVAWLALQGQPVGARPGELPLGWPGFFVFLDTEVQLMRENVLEVEVDAPKDSHLWFPPIGAAVRGRLDLMRLVKRDPHAAMLTSHFPKGVPGQRIHIDLAAKQCSIVEPLHDAEWADCKRELERRSLPIPQAVELHPGAHVPDWLWGVKRAIDAGYVRIVKGELPDDLGEETKRPETKDPGEDRIDRLCDLVERLLERLVPASAR
jgi:hypothetical protein